MTGWQPDSGRYIYIYCSSTDQKRKFQELAEKAGASLSKFLLSVLEEAISEHQEHPRLKISEDMRTMEEELARLREEAKTAEKLLRRYEAENRRLREATKFREGFEGERQLDAELIAVLRRGPTHDYRLLEILGIEAQDLAQTSAIQAQLEVLERHGRIKKTTQGWKWLE